MRTLLVITKLIITSFGCENTLNNKDNNIDGRIEIVKKYIQYKNENNISKVDSLLDTTITIKMNGEEIEKDYFFNQIEDMYNTGFSDTIFTISQNDSLIKVIVNSSNKFIKFLKSSPIRLNQEFIVNNNKIQSISSDTANGTNQVIKELDERTERFGEWYRVKYPSEFKAIKDIFSIPEKHLQEYSLLSENEVEHFFRTHLNGIYVCKKGIYNKLEFKGKSTVIVYSMGIPFPTSYVVDEDYIRIKTDKSDLLLQIKDSKTLIGEGFAKGTFNKK